MTIPIISRLHLPDLIRLLAIFLMVFYHFSYDLVLFEYAHFDIVREPFWWFLPRLIVFLFLFTVGFSLWIAHHRFFLAKPFFKRFLKIFSASILVSIVTYFLFPDRWIYFGTLHCISLSTIGTILFLRLPKLAGVLGILLFTLSHLGYDIPWIQLEHTSMDYVELFPWIGASFLGLFWGSFYEHWRHQSRLENHRFFKTKTWSFFQKISEHSLLLYLIHQPILFLLFKCFALIKTKF